MTGKDKDVIVTAEIEAIVTNNPSANKQAGKEIGESVGSGVAETLTESVSKSIKNAESKAASGKRKPLNVRAQKGAENWERIKAERVAASEAAKALLIQKEQVREAKKELAVEQDITEEIKKQNRLKRLKEEASPELRAAATKRAQEVQGRLIGQKSTIQGRTGKVDGLTISHISELEESLINKAKALREQYIRRTGDEERSAESFIGQAGSREYGERAREARKKELKQIAINKQPEIDAKKRLEGQRQIDAATDMWRKLAVDNEKQAVLNEKKIQDGRKQIKDATDKWVKLASDNKKQAIANEKKRLDGEKTIGKSVDAWSKFIVESDKVASANIKEKNDAVASFRRARSIIAERNERKRLDGERSISKSVDEWATFSKDAEKKKIADAKEAAKKTNAGNKTIQSSLDSWVKHNEDVSKQREKSLKEGEKTISASLGAWSGFAKKEEKTAETKQKQVGAAVGGFREARAKISQSELAGAVSISQKTGKSLQDAKVQLTGLISKYKELGLTHKNALRAALADADKLNEKHKGILGNLRESLGVAAKWFLVYKAMNVVTRSISSTFHYMAASALEFYKAQEQQTLGLRGIIDANYKIADSQGNQLATSERLQAINEMAKGTWKELQTIGFSVVGTTEDLLDIFNAILPKTAQMGGSLEDAKKITEGTILAANALGISYATARTSLVSVLNGNVRMSNAFTSAMGFSEKEVKKLIQSGELLDTIIAKMAPFKLLQRESTELLGSKLETFRELVGQISSMIGQPIIQGVKDAITYFQEMLGYVDEVTGRFVFKPEVLETLEDAQLIFEDILIVVEEIWKKWMSIPKTIDFIRNAGLTLATRGPVGAAMALYTGKLPYTPFHSAEDNEPTLRGSTYAQMPEVQDYSIARHQKNVIEKQLALQEVDDAMARYDALIKEKASKEKIAMALRGVGYAEKKVALTTKELRKDERAIVRIKAAIRGRGFQGEELARRQAEVQHYTETENLLGFDLRKAQASNRNQQDTTDYKALLEKKKQDIAELQSVLQEEITVHKDARQDLSEQFTNDLITRQVYSDRLNSWFDSSIDSIKKKYAKQKAILEELAKVNDKTAQDYANMALKKLPGQEAAEIQGINKEASAATNATTKYYQDQADRIRAYNISVAKAEADTELKIIEQKLQRREVLETDAIDARYRAELLAYDVAIEQTFAAFKAAGVNNLTQGQEWEKAVKAREDYIKTFGEEERTRRKLNQWQQLELQVQTKVLDIQSQITKIESLRDQGYLSAAQYWDMQRNASADLIAARKEEIELAKKKRDSEVLSANDWLQANIAIKNMVSEYDQLIAQQAIYNNSLMRMSSIFDEMSSIGEIRGLSQVGSAFGSLGKAVSGFSAFQNFLKQQKKVSADARAGKMGGYDESGAYVQGTLSATTGITKIWGSIVGTATKAAKAAPMIGAAIEAGAAIFSIFKGVFSRAAKKIGERINKDLEAIQNAYSAGTTNLVQTMEAVKTARTNAIAQLSGRKGGQEQLDKILPDMDRLLTDLEKQQKQIFENFNNQLELLRQPEGMKQTASAIMQLVSTLKEYIGAGGDAALISEYWTRSLAQIGDELKKNITNAEKEAIDRAIELNDLYEQRADIIKKYNEEELKLRTQGSIERQLPNILKAGKELQSLREQRDKELEAVNRQIKITEARVDAEKTIFDLTGDIASLKERSMKMEIEGYLQITEQIRQQQELLKGGLEAYAKNFQYLFPNMDWSKLGFTGNTAAAGTTINVNIEGINVSASTTNPSAFATQFASSLTDELHNKLTRRALY